MKYTRDSEGKLTKRDSVKFGSYDEACKKYINNIVDIITHNRKFQDNPPVLMLSGGVDSMVLGCILKKYFGLKDSITVGCVKDTNDIKVSQDTASKLGIDNKLFLVTLEEVLDNTSLCRGKNIKTVFDLVYYLVFKLCLQQTDVKNTDLVQGDGADTLLGSISVFMYRDVPWVMKNYNVDKDEAKTIIKQQFYNCRLDPKDKKHKGSGHLFMELSEELGANAIMAFKHQETLRWVNDLEYTFSRPDIKLLPKEMIKYLKYDPINVNRTIMEKGTGIYEIMKKELMKKTGKTHPNSAVKEIVNL